MKTPTATAAAVLVRLWNEGKSVLDDLTDPNVAAVEGAARRTAGEAHRFLGLVRFSELADGTYYAPITPDCDVLRLIAEHFSAKVSRHVLGHPRRSPRIRGFSTEWASLDPRRGSLRCAVGALPAGDRFREAWKRYFAAIAIEGQKTRRFRHRSCRRSTGPTFPKWSRGSQS
jgi:probable DNA metabolism protein